MRLLPSCSRAVLALGLFFLAAACTGGPSAGGKPPSKTGVPSRITWRLYKTDHEITLVNESHSDRLELYSKAKERREAATKVQNDEIVEAVLDYFDRAGYQGFASTGSAPRAQIGRASQSLEVERQGRTTFMVWSPDRPEKERACFVICRDALVEIWNETYAAQTIEVGTRDGPPGVPPTEQKPSR
jgi:hypothetical protein